MKLFDVYPLFQVTPVRGQGSWLWDEHGVKYLDLYGGHAVISIGHSHPQYTAALSAQLQKIAFYSNSIQNPLQRKLAEKLGEVSGYPDYQLFLCNSGAEANENALKLASFLTGRKKVIAFNKAFHGRTSGAIAVTDNPKIASAFDKSHEVVFVPLNDQEAFNAALDNAVAAVIIESIQGLGGIHEADPGFLQFLEQRCNENGSILILDEIQSGYGRTGKFFAHQYAGIKPKLITVAKGMGNGFPMGGVLIHPDIKSWHGMLGTTFGGNYLACVAGLVVLEVIEKENLMDNAEAVGTYLVNELNALPELQPIRGKGLMIGFDVPEERKSMRHDLLYTHKIFTGESKPNTIRLLPSLAVSKEEIEIFLAALKFCLTKTSERATG
jgi:acetylornithine/N-succinyldiaminopimelate aminotransferase